MNEEKYTQDTDPSSHIPKDIQIQKSSSQNDYDPNQAYNYERAHRPQDHDDLGHPIPPKKRKPNDLARYGMFCSIASILLCCCNMYAVIIASIAGITLCICSRFFNNPEERWYTQAVVGLIIGIISLVFNLGTIAINYILVPYLIANDPEFAELYNQTIKMIYELLDQYETSEGQK